MKSDPIKILIDEHDVISQVQEIAYLLKELKEFDTVNYTRHTKSLINFFKEYCDKIHHYKEDEVLFMELNNHPKFSQPEIITELTEHHIMFREKIENLENHLDGKAFNKTQLILEDYLNEILNHIAIENVELFVMAQSVFSEDELEIMYYKFKDIDYEFGEGKKEEFERMINLIKAELQLNHV